MTSDLEVLAIVFYHPAFLFVWGACWGSFLNVVIYRVPLGKSVVHPPSACPHCGKFIKGYDNIPVLSWFLLGGKCRQCKTPYSIRYALVEALIGALCATGGFLFRENPAAGLGLGHALMALYPTTILAVRHRMLPWYLATALAASLGLMAYGLWA